jgi:hypothetical protein
LVTFDEQGGEFPLLEMFCTFALSVGAAVSQILSFLSFPEYLFVLELMNQPHFFITHFHNKIRNTPNASLKQSLVGCQ